MSEHMALVTRAFVDIGRATAMTFTREGVSVAVSGRRDEEGNRRLVALARPSILPAPATLRETVLYMSNGDGPRPICQIIDRPRVPRRPAYERHAGSPGVAPCLFLGVYQTVIALA
jgi:hypothetical protein